MMTVNLPQRSFLVLAALATSVTLLTSLTGCQVSRGERSASGLAGDDGVYAGTFVYREEVGGETFLRARLSEGESQTLYQVMRVEPVVYSQGNVKSIHSSDNGFDVYCIEPTTPLERWACTLSINESLLNGFSETLVQLHTTEPLLVASVYQPGPARKMFLAFETQANLDEPSYQRDLNFDKVSIGIWQELGDHDGMRGVQVSMKIQLPE